MKKPKLNKARDSSKKIFESHWGFKKSFKQDYGANKVFKKIKHFIIRKYTMGL